MKHFMKTVVTPLGDLVMAATETSILALAWKKEQLREYFRGDRKQFELPLDFAGTDFQKRVWTELGRIPFGKTWSYQELARKVENPCAVRAVGTASGKNPVCIFIPRHRVVRLSGELGGYAGGTGNKAFLLKLESHPGKDWP